jgi:hypothetical protein
MVFDGTDCRGEHLFTSNGGGKYFIEGTSIQGSIRISRSRTESIQPSKVKSQVTTNDHVWNQLKNSLKFWFRDEYERARNEELNEG